MGKEFQTRAGIEPSQTSLPFTITTEQVRDYLQKKLDIVVNKGLPEDSKISINVYTTEAGVNFLPFVVILPEEAENRDSAKASNNIPMIFNTKEIEKTVKLKDPIYKLFSSYAYNKKDKEAFFSDDWRRIRRVSRNTSSMLKQLSEPKKVNIRNASCIALLVDPIRVFHDMLIMQNDNRDFMVEIVKWQKIRSGEYRYDIKRVINSKKGKNNKYKDAFFNEINNRIKGNSGRRD